MTKCTFVTYSDLPNLDPDDRRVLDILEKRGYECAAAVWDSPEVDWSAAGVTVLRSTWDYHRKYDHFLSWVEATSLVTEFFNRPKYIRWNTHKSYLNDLANVGIATVPTQWLMKGEQVDVAKELQRILDEAPAGKLIVKPAVGLATSGVLLVEKENFDDAVEHVNKLLADNDVMVQPFISSVKERGEKSLVFINGRYCHAAQKRAFQALATAGGAGEKQAEASTDEVYLAEDAMTAVSNIVRRREPEYNEQGEEIFMPPPLYARVDIVRDDNNLPLVLELELVEPSLFMSYDEQTAEFFADAIEHLIKRSERMQQAKA